MLIFVELTFKFCQVTNSLRSMGSAMFFGIVVVSDALSYLHELHSISIIIYWGQRGQITNSLGTSFVAFVNPFLLYFIICTLYSTYQKHYWSVCIKRDHEYEFIYLRGSVRYCTFKLLGNSSHAWFCD